MKQIIGVALILSPILAVLGIVAVESGWKDVAIIVASSAVMFAAIFSGIKLLQD